MSIQTHPGGVSRYPSSNMHLANLQSVVSIFFWWLRGFKTSPRLSFGRASFSEIQFPSFLNLVRTSKGL